MELYGLIKLANDGEMDPRIQTRINEMEDDYMARRKRNMAMGALGGATAMGGNQFLNMPQKNLRFPAGGAVLGGALGAMGGKWYNAMTSMKERDRIMHMKETGELPSAEDSAIQNKQEQIMRGKLTGMGLGAIAGGAAGTIGAWKLHSPGKEGAIPGMVIGAAGGNLLSNMASGNRRAELGQLKEDALRREMERGNQNG